MNNPSAFPNPQAAHPDCEFGTCSTGMTLRDYFAAHAPITMDDVMKYYKDLGNDPPLYSEFFSCWTQLRYEYADSMLEQRHER